MSDYKDRVETERAAERLREKQGPQVPRVAMMKVLTPLELAYDLFVAGRFDTPWECMRQADAFFANASQYAKEHAHEGE